MKRELSILIPIYNSDCRNLVITLSQQAEDIEGLQYEIVVADDGSSDREYVARCKEISALPRCRFIDRRVNSGRAAIRNFLAGEARHEWLLFIDGDMAIPTDDFLNRWLEADFDEVAYGGYIVGGKADMTSLRYIYEKQCEHMHTAEERRKRPFQHFHTCNFMIRRSLMLEQPFDERIRQYGYEDVLFGKTLRKAGITICHADNPAGFYDFESNAHFVSKTEEGLRTLNQFRNELRGYSQMLTIIDGIHIGVIHSGIRLWHRIFGKAERRNLCGPRPCLRLFKLYKLGYFLTIKQQNND